MPEEIRVWNIKPGNHLEEVKRGKLDLEDRIESWLEQDISILSTDLLVIGRQVGTAFGGSIDLLCLNSNGDSVIVELKRHKTPREVTSQALDYASWTKDLSNDDITKIANQYLGDKGPLEKAFIEKFNIELPQTLNESHSMRIVASEIDQSSERIIKYLSDTHGININAATFQYFKADDGREILARVFLIEPSLVEYKTQAKSTSKRKPNLTYEQLQSIATDNGVGEVYKYFSEELGKYFSKSTSRSSIRFEAAIDDSRKVIFNLSPEKSSSERGLNFQIYLKRMSKYLNVSEEKVEKILPCNKVDWRYTETSDDDYSGYEGFFMESAEIEYFLSELSHLKSLL